MSVFGTLLRTMVERGARKYTLADLIQKLDTTGKVVADRFENAADTPRNREQMAHIIGIERWGERRLRVALGEPPVADEYNGYRPDTAESLEALRVAFAETRRRTLETARELERATGAVERTAPHNDMGEVSVRGWLSYLDAHATRESRFMKQR